VSAAPRQAAERPFGHPPETLRFWKRLVREALRLSGGTPLYVFSAKPIAERIAELDSALAKAGLQSAHRAGRSALPTVRHWLSCKTQPIPPLLRWWRARGGDIEVVSEFELRAALTEGFPPGRILVNGPAKHHWLPRLPLRGLAVNFDSPAELKALLPLAKKLGWRAGVRLCTGEEFDPGNPKLPTQFGFVPAEAVKALKELKRAGMGPEMLHFHLRTNVESPAVYERTLREVAEVCREARVNPRFVDMGGGIPPRHTRSLDGQAFDAGWQSGRTGGGESDLRAGKAEVSRLTSAATGFEEFAAVLARSAEQFPGLCEIWLENGRFVNAGSGVLVVSVLDVKERRGVRQLICDGGRTLNALVSNWEQHELLTLRERSGPSTLSAVHGPTCMAFDQLALRPLPCSIRAGDRLLWLEAGAYHIPWETRFSHGHAAVAWHDERGLRIVRERQDFEEWWGGWT
jgi:diaminopimelate decarboxylase